MKKQLVIFLFGLLCIFFPSLKLQAEVTETGIPYEETFLLLTESGEEVHIIEPNCLENLEDVKAEITGISIPSQWTRDVIIPIHIKQEAFAFFTLSDAAGAETLSFEVYKDVSCTSIISRVNDGIEFKEETVCYVKIGAELLQKGEDTIFLFSVTCFQPNASTLVNGVKQSCVSLDGEKTSYYEIKVNKTSQIILDFSGKEIKAEAALCNSGKKALTNTVCITDSNFKAVYTVEKGTYFIRVKSANLVYIVQPTIKAITSSAGTTKSKAKKVVVNGAAKTGVFLATDRTIKSYWFKFYNPKKQSIFLYAASYFSTDTLSMSVYRANGDCYGTKELLAGINLANGTQIADLDGNGKVLPLAKGTYYIKVTKNVKKMCGYFRLKVSTKN